MLQGVVLCALAQLRTSVDAALVEGSGLPTFALCQCDAKKRNAKIFQAMATLEWLNQPLHSNAEW